jgi:hypothetical protein
MSTSTDLLIPGGEAGRIKIDNMFDKRLRLRIRRCGLQNQGNYLDLNARGREEVRMRAGESWEAQLSTGCYIVSLEPDRARGQDFEIGIRPENQGYFWVQAGERPPGSPIAYTLSFESDGTYFDVPY